VLATKGFSRRVRCAFSTHQIICRRWCVKRRDTPYRLQTREVSKESENKILVARIWCVHFLVSELTWHLACGTDALILLGI
jgi:hypothetical protein